jgi:hypothetical protein
MIVGAYALAFHGAPRYTGDLDLMVKSDLENAQKIMKVLQKFGFGSLDLSVEDFTTKERVVQLGVPPVRVDLITSITGVDWDQAVSHRVPGTFGGVSTFFIGKDDFILNKKACGRYKDLADIEVLGERPD